MNTTFSASFVLKRAIGRVNALRDDSPVSAEAAIDAVLAILTDLQEAYT